jgi:hypothetical protein
VTWYANRIYLHATPSALARLEAEPALVGHIFLLDGPLLASWQPLAEPVAPPAGGLVVVKEVGEAEEPSVWGAEDYSPGRPWHPWHTQNEFVPWDHFHGAASLDIDPPGLRDLIQTEPPPAPFLRFLKDIHIVSGVPVTYYATAMWGGDIESEYAWVFDDREVVYAYRSDEEIVEVVEVDRQGRRSRQGDVLQLALAHLGLQLPTGYFAPHTRGFDWTPFRHG